MNHETDTSEWSSRIHRLKRETLELWSFMWNLRADGRLSLDETGQIAKAYNDVFRKAGRMNLRGDPDDALTYALYREGNHAVRRALIGMLPDIEPALNCKVPPVPGRE